jgi:hypothetical protein
LFHAKLNSKTTKSKQGNDNNQNWATFSYHSPIVRKITNLFKNTQINIAFRTQNNIYKQLTHKSDNTNPSGIYEIKCNTCGLKYVGQSGRQILTRHKEHIRYIRNNNATSAYAGHILDNRHEYGTADDTLRMIKPCRKGSRMNHWENLYIQIYRQHSHLIEEQQTNDTNQLFTHARPPHTIALSSAQNVQR